MIFSLFFSLLFALFFAALMWPLQVRFARHAPALLASLGALLCVLSLLAVLGLLARGCLREARSRAPQYFNAVRQEYSSLQDWGAPRGIEFPIAGEIRETLGEKLGEKLGGLKSRARKMLIISGALILCFAAAMSSLDARRLDMRRHSENRSGSESGDTIVLARLYGVAEKLHRYLAARAGTALLSGAGVWAFSLFVGLDFALLWGTCAALLKFIPYLGAPVAALLPALWTLFQFHSLPVALLVFAGIALLQWMIGAFLPTRWRAANAVSNAASDVVPATISSGTG